MTNVFNMQPDLLAHTTNIRRVSTTAEGRTAIAVDENILRPSGGGQPCDHGTVTGEFGVVPISDAFKRDGDTWIELDGPLKTAPVPGEPVSLTVNAVRRGQLCRCHSLTHLGMATAKRFVRGYESKGAQIGDDAAIVTLVFRAEEIPDRERIHNMDIYMRSIIHSARPIQVQRAKSLFEAERTFPEWRVDPDNMLTGRLRIIHIEGVDANPCSGSHAATTAGIGPFEWLDCRRDGRGLAVLQLRRTNVWMDWWAEA